ncbi:MAG: hypothetical protein KTR13_02985 [Saprospiraceae bacterium]|nr:hypothetical protein [Saprospiraceae bacterium]
MVEEKVAVLDLGTNSYHLLIAKVEPHGFEELVKRKEFVRMGAGGLTVIDEEKFSRAMNTLGRFKKLMDEYGVTRSKVYATEGMRKASNSQDFINEIKKLFNFDIEIIDGLREAELIYKGVREAVPLNGQKKLLMDIGGGSCEFIIANDEEIFWKNSFPIGAAVLKNKFHDYPEAIFPPDYKNLVNFLDVHLQELWQAIAEHKPKALVGASGSFMSLVNLQRSINTLYPIMEEKSELVNLSGFKHAHLLMLKSTLDERLSIPDLESARAPMMPVATTLISLVLSKLPKIRSITVSHYAMKEGMMAEMAKELEFTF